MSATALILAAGEGTRMKSQRPKVAHEILGVPMVSFVASAARAAGCERIVVVTGHGAETVEALLSGVTFVRQEQQLGTGHAVMCARDVLRDAHGSLVVVLSGDTPLISAETIAGLLAMRESSAAALTVLTTRLADPSGYGRIVRDRDGEVSAIVEHRDCTAEQHRIDEVNTGTYCFDAGVLFAHLDRLESENSQREYLTDIVEVFNAEGLTVAAAETADPLETLGVNTRVQLAEAGGVLQRRINHRLMLDGVTMTDPDLVWVGPDVEVARDVELLPMTMLLGSTTVESGALIGPNSRVTDSHIGARAIVDSSVVIGSRVGPGASVGPVSYLRPGAVLEAHAKAGACVEIKNSVVGERSKVPHLSYIGDATIGTDVNVGAGSITCNYDGRSKHPTHIGDGAFLGSDTMLVAPVRIGEGAVTGAGSVITRDVPPGSLAVERGEQRVLEDWARRRRESTDAE